MIAEPARGEVLFENLLRLRPAEPMVIFKRGEPYAALGKKDLARQDLAYAAERFPLEKWKQIAREALAQLR